MPTDLEEQMLQILQSRSDGSPPITIGDFARIFGASPGLITRCAQHMVSNGLALPFEVQRRGVPVLQGLRKIAAQA